MDDHLALARDIGPIVGGQRDAGDTEVGERAELARVGDAVAIRVLPHAEAGEFGVGGAELTIAVAVILQAQPFEVGRAGDRKADLAAIIGDASSEERRVGKACSRTGRSRWAPY